MKRSVSTLILLVAMLLAGSQAVMAQQSDYQLTQEFKSEYSALQADIRELQSAEEAKVLYKQVENLQQNYVDHSELLNNALYPDSFEERISALKQQLNNTEHKLLIIEDKEEKLSRLSDELSSYKNEIAYLKNRTDSLNDAILASEKSESELSGLVQQYRQNLEQRDEFVLALTDSLFATYKDLQSDEIAELAEQSKVGSVQQDDNPLALIRNVMDENIRILENGDQKLQTEDYLRMYVVQNRFEEVWNEIGNDLTTVYGTENAQRWKKQINRRLDEWNQLASKKMWASMDIYLEQNQVDLAEFNSNESFYAALDTFVTKATDASREKVVTNDDYKDFQAFYDFWNNKIKNDWGRYVQEGEVLTMSQISAIDSEVMSWRDEAKPRSFVIPILFGVSLLIIVALIILLARNKKSSV